MACEPMWPSVVWSLGDWALMTSATVWDVAVSSRENTPPGGCAQRVNNAQIQRDATLMSMFPVTCKVDRRDTF
jgi:hypothetical protein